MSAPIPQTPPIARGDGFTEEARPHLLCKVSRQLPRQKWPPSKRRCSAMNSLLVILALKCLVEYFIDSRTRSCTATIADTHRDGNPAGNTAYVAPLTKSNVFLALVDVSFPTEFANRRFFFSWHSRVQSPPVSPMEVTLHHLALILCELPHTHPLSFSRAQSAELLDRGDTW
jgi:hypothetical protein